MLKKLNGFLKVKGQWKISNSEYSVLENVSSDLQKLYMLFPQIFTIYFKDAL